MGIDRRSPPMATEDPADALAVLGDETRMAILRELAEAAGPLAFSELRERAGVRDTGRFNYHLTKLCEYFVRETPEGYELGHAGSRVIDAAGSADPGGVEDTDTCPVCGEDDCDRLIHVHLRAPWR